MLYIWVNDITSWADETQLDVAMIHDTAGKFPVWVNEYRKFPPLAETADIWLLFGRQGREWRTTQRASEKKKR